MVQDDVLLVAWQDNNLVLELITAYDIREMNNFVFQKRKRLSKTSINTRIGLHAFKKNEKDI